MKLYTTARAPNPRRVLMFIAEKGIEGVELVEIDIMKGHHRSAEYTERNPLAQVPTLELEDGTRLTESRAICSYLESVRPEPNLMGGDGRERAQIEMWDRRVELGLFLPLAMWVRHSHPALAVLEPRQLPEYAQIQRERARTFARWLDGQLAGRSFVAGARFSIADITAFCGLEFSRLVKYNAAEDGLTNLQRWRDAIAARPSAAR